MINIKLNNQAVTISPACVLAAVLKQHGYTDQHFAVAINQKFIPRSQYDKTLVQENDCIEILSPMQGG